MNAQMRSGYKFGINLTTMKMQIPGLTSKPRMPVGIHFGGNFEIPVSGKFYFQSGFLFTSKGTDYTIDSTFTSLAPSFIEVPLNAVFKFGNGRYTRFFLYGGPYFSVAMGGYKIIGSDPLYNLSWGRGRDLRPFDMGFNFGAGINRKGRTFTVQYGTGLSNLAPFKGSVMKNRVIGISIGSLMAPKKKKK
jgi:hypothetical protein